jgi:putative ABC transport system permease protein
LANFALNIIAVKTVLIYFKLFRESWFFAIQALKANMLRSVLSLMGITIGIVAIIAVYTMVDTMESSVRDGVDSLGDDVIYVQRSPWAPENGEYAWWDYIRRPAIEAQYATELEESLTKADGIAFMGNTSVTIERQNNFAENVGLIVADYDYYKVRSFNLEHGRYFTATEANSGRNYGVIGANVKKALFGQANAIGKTVKIRGRKVRVIGVLELEGESLINNTLDNTVLISVAFGRTIVNLRRLETMLIVKSKDNVTTAELREEIRGAMRRIRGIRPMEGDDFALNEASLLSSGLDEFFGVVNVMGTIIGLFSILVGGFSIANIMFVSVKERTSLIGIQKSLGAKNAFILWQFLFEAVILCLIGGAIGLLIIYLLTIPVNAAMDMEIVLSTKNIAIGLSISVGIGLISGILPARSASRLDPVEAIRST